jgi:uncharacterized RDD family membrane protein YckC
MSQQEQSYCRPSLPRYLCIIAYDTLLLLSVLLVASFVAVALNGGEAIGSDNPFFMLYIFAVCFFFYGWFWTHGGQTLGMRAWKVYLIGNQQHEVTWLQALFRFIGALMAWLPLGFGIWWQWLGKENKSWPDMLSATRLHYNQNAKNKPLSPLS